MARARASGAPGALACRRLHFPNWPWLLAAALLHPVTSDASKSILGRMGVAFNCPHWDSLALQHL